jgi:hypothetical protein
MRSALLSTTSPAPTKARRSNNGSAVGVINDWRARNNPGQFGMAGLDDVFGSDDESEVVGPLAHKIRASSNTSYPGTSDGDNILRSMWDGLRGVDGAGYNMRRLLFLRHSTSLQIWDCTNLGSVSEIPNLSGSDWGRVKFAGVLLRLF